MFDILFLKPDQNFSEEIEKLDLPAKHRNENTNLPTGSDVYHHR